MNEFSENDINRFFAEESGDIEALDLGEPPVALPGETISQIIRKIKKASVKYYLYNELVELIAILKNENVNLN